jgi:site-specific DNA-methyltransferase (adenine-specific)
MNIERKINSSTSPAIAAMQCYAQPSIQLFNCDNLELMDKMGDESVDVILTDPPYLYLKNQKLEREFDEQLFFSECKRLLTKNGFIVMFGRGTSFYRWNTILADLGFKFKEEIVWDKLYSTSPLMRLSRIHETISIFTKGKGTINKVKVPYLEMKSHDLDSVIQDINRIKGALNNTKSLDAVLAFLESNNVPTNSDNVLSTTVSSIIKTQDRCASVLSGIKNGMNEKSIIRTDRYVYKNNSVVGLKDITKPDRAVSVVQSIDNGMTEKTIIKQVRDHYSAIHPTQKPVRLLERLLALVVPKEKEPSDIIVFDPFGGSFSTMEAVYNMGMEGISCEIDKEYFDLGKERIEKLPPHQTALFD